MDAAIIISSIALSGTVFQALTSYRTSIQTNWNNRAIELTKDDINKFDKAYFSGLQYYSKLQDLASSLGALAKQMRADGISFDRLSEQDKAKIGIQFLHDHSGDPEAIRDLKNTAISVFTLLGSDNVNAVLSDELDHAYHDLQEQFFAHRNLPSLESIASFNSLLDEKLNAYSAEARRDREVLRNAFWNQQGCSISSMLFSTIRKFPRLIRRDRARK